MKLNYCSKRIHHLVLLDRGCGAAASANRTEANNSLRVYLQLTPINVLQQIYMANLLSNLIPTSLSKRSGVSDMEFCQEEVKCN